MTSENERIQSILLTGLPPIDTVFAEITGISGKNLVGYKSSVIINSPEFGVLTPKQYRVVSEKTQVCCAKLATNQINAVCTMLYQRFLGSKLREAQWVSVYIPFKFLKNDAALMAVKRIGKQYGDGMPKRLCFEFSSSILFEDKEFLKASLSSLKETGASLMLSDYGEEFCPTMRIVGLPFDYVLLDASLEKNLTAENVPVTSLIATASANGAKIIAEGLKKENADAAFECGVSLALSGRAITARELAGYREAAK